MLESKMTDNKLDEKNPENWLELFGDYLYSFALFRVKHKTLAEDLAQDTLLAGFKSWQSFSGKSSVKTWLTSILKHKILDHFRSSSNKLDLTSELTDIVDKHFNSIGLWNTILQDWASNPESNLNNKQLQAVLDKCLEKLSNNARKVFILKVIDDVPNEDICKALDLTASNTWVLLHRAKMAIRDCIELNWIKGSK